MTRDPVAAGRSWAGLLHLPLAVTGIAVWLVVSVAADKAALPATSGWHELPHTALRAVCPPNGFGKSSYDFGYYCISVVDAWNSAAFDTKRNRLVVWGGGHNDYLGNELYAIDLNAVKVERLTDPGLPIATTSSCPEALTHDTQPNSRHTYDGVAYMEHVDRLFIYGGSLATCGFMSRGTWTFSFEGNVWERRSPKGTAPNAVPGVVTAYDPNTRRVFLHDDQALYRYDFESDRYERLGFGDAIDYHMTAVIDPVRRKLVLVGAGDVYVYDIGPGSWHTRRTLRTTGGDRIVQSSYPGLTYDARSSRIVAWGGGDTVYSLDLDAGRWRELNRPGGPGPSQPNGTFKRWSYAPAADVFVLVNSVDQNVWIFRLDPSDAQKMS